MVGLRTSIPDSWRNEVLERHEGALGPEGGAGLGGIGPGEDAGADRAFPQPLVEPGEGVVAADSGPMSRRARGAQREGAGDGTGVGPAGQGLGGIEGPAAAQENTSESIRIKA